MNPLGPGHEAPGMRDEADRLTSYQRLARASVSEGSSPNASR